MRIQARGGAAPTGASARPNGPAAAGFEPAAASVREAAQSSPASALNAVSSLDAILALQEALGPMERRRRAVKRAGRLLDILDSVKLSLLEGGSPSSMLNALKQAAGEARGETDDPGLEGVLDEIETRAAVELAKAEMARSAPSHAA
jgi:hypothetical protein